MSKIKIITLHCPLNYGAALQAYALKTYLNIIGHQAELIDYRPDYIVDKQKLTYVGNQAYSKNILKRWAYIFFKCPSRYKIKHNFQTFLKNELCEGHEIYYSNEELKQNPPNADVFFAGSDQIWNTQLENGWDDAFFLSFVNEGKKCSYAASMAISRELEKDEQERFQRMLQQFDRISVREQDAVNILQPLTNLKVHCVLDPVFLLPKERWIQLANKREMDVSAEDYILIYPMGNGDNVIKIAQQLSKDTGFPVYSISQTIRRTSIDKQFKGYTPYQFLHLFQNAKYVVTNSFHGTAFSIIFRKKFWACSVVNTSSRLTSLLHCLKIMNRFISGNCCNMDLLKPINYDEVYGELEKQKMSSKKFIYNCINNNQQK